MKMKKFLTAALALTMAASMSVTAFAADGTEADGPVGGDTTNASTGSASMTKTGDAAWQTSNDDDAVAAANDTTADINVWAKVTNEGEDTYKVDIGWGAMKFQFDAGVGTWDPETHTYTSGTAAGWTTDGYVDGTNNKVTVTNHSNNAVTAGFTYTMDEQNKFNPTGTTDVVKGYFYATNDNAVAGAAVLDTSANTPTNLLTEAVKLHSADTYKDTANASAVVDAAVATGTEGAEASWADTGRSDDVFFAFSGKPDNGTSTTLSDFTKVGVITVTVAPMTDLTGFEG